MYILYILYICIFCIFGIFVYMYWIWELLFVHIGLHTGQVAVCADSDAHLRSKACLRTAHQSNSSKEPPSQYLRKERVVRHRERSAFMSSRERLGQREPTSLHGTMTTTILNIWKLQKYQKMPKRSSEVLSSFEGILKHWPSRRAHAKDGGNQNGRIPGKCNQHVETVVLIPLKICGGACYLRSQTKHITSCCFFRKSIKYEACATCGSKQISKIQHIMICILSFRNLTKTGCG